MMILAGDIGGTHTRLMLAQAGHQNLNVHYRADFDNVHYQDFFTLLKEFLSTSGYLNDAANNIDMACLAIAGPIENRAASQRVRMTNLDWTIDTNELCEKFPLVTCVLINDFVAQVYGLDTLRDEELLVLQKGLPEKYGVRALIGAGTGLGMALAVPFQMKNSHSVSYWKALPSQGGMMDFAPVDAGQLRLWHSLQPIYGRVSNERVLSGSGLLNSYQVQCDVDNVLASLTYPGEIADAALKQNNSQAVVALNQFVSIYGAVAGNLALMSLSLGGVYITGGIAPRILPALQNGLFIEAFNAKAPLAEWLQKIPVHIVLNQYAGLQGAAQFALQQLEKSQ